MNLFHPDIWRQQMVAALFFWGLIPACYGGAGLLLDTALGWKKLPYSLWLTIIAACMFAAGLSLVGWSTFDLYHRGKGTPSPLRPAKQLLVDGSYRLCRHPMFLGYDLILLAIAFGMRSLATLVFSFPFFLILSILWLRKEERILASRFRDEYPPYQQSTPFLLPGLRGRDT